eukprot:808180-Pyramimonas_sp.AAC.1
MKLLRIPSDLFVLHTKVPAKRNQKRIAAFVQWYDAAGTTESLKRAALCLRLTSHATKLTAKKSNAADDPTAVPTLVRLGRGEVQQNTSLHISEMLPMLHADTELNVADALVQVLVTGSHLIARFDVYSKFPTQLWTLTK